MHSEVGSIKTTFVGASIFSSVAVVVGIIIMPVMIARLETAVNEMTEETLLFKVAADALVTELELRQKFSYRHVIRNRLARQANFLDVLERSKL